MSGRRSSTSTPRFVGPPSPAERGRKARIVAAALLFTTIFSPASAVQPDEVLKDPVLERRAREISAGLRCLVCQNQSIDDSDAPLAKDLRVLVRERLQAGESDNQIRTFLVQRYGEFVLLSPTFGLHTVLLWLGPSLVLAAGAVGLVIAFRRRRREATTPLTAEERASIEALLKRDGAP